MIFNKFLKDYYIHITILVLFLLYGLYQMNAKENFQNEELKGYLHKRCPNGGIFREDERCYFENTGNIFKYNDVLHYGSSERERNAKKCGQGEFDGSNCKLIHTNRAILKDGVWSYEALPPKVEIVVQQTLMARFFNWISCVFFGKC